MFHISNLGSFGGSVKAYADMNGYIPEAGDPIESFSFDGETRRDLEGDAWAEFVAEAVSATADAQAALSAWREARA